MLENAKLANHIGRGTLLILGGGISFGSLMFESKLAEVIGKTLLALSGSGK